MKALRTLAVAVFLLATMSGFILAQAPANGIQGNSARNYDPTTEATLTGTVQQVLQQAGKRGWNGTHLLVKTDQEIVSVHLGPSSYLQKQGLSFEIGDAVSVVGSRTMVGGKPVLVAREITSGSKTVVLRDAQGVPNWSRGRAAQK